MTIKHFKLVALIESLSWAVLLIAMALKYFFDREEATQIPGMVHGFLFVAFLAALLVVTIKYEWSLLRAVKIALLSIIPIGGYFLIDHSVGETPEAELQSA